MKDINLSMLKMIKKKRKIKKDNIIKALILMIFILCFFEIYLFFWSENDNIEPYQWGSRTEIPYKINDCYELFSNHKHKDKTRIVIIGDSRPECAFYPEICDEYFDDETISYNLAISGTGILVQSFLIQKIVIPKLKPDIIIWELSIPQDFEDNKENLELDERTLETPMGRYYTENPDKSDFEELCKYNLLKYSRIYRYRANLRPDLFYLNEYEKRNIDNFNEWFERGHLKMSETIKTTNENVRDVSFVYTLHEESVNKFFDTIEIMEDNTDFFLIVSGPNRYMKLVFPDITAILNKLSLKNFLNLNGNDSFYHDDLWFNPTHLNVIGATLYTKLVYEKISIYI